MDRREGDASRFLRAHDADLVLFLLPSFLGELRRKTLTEGLGRGGKGTLHKLDAHAWIEFGYTHMRHSFCRLICVAKTYNVITVITILVCYSTEFRTYSGIPRLVKFFREF